MEIHEPYRKREEMGKRGRGKEKRKYVSEYVYAYVRQQRKESFSEINSIGPPL